MERAPTSSPGVTAAGAARRAAVLSDVHGNAVALEAVLEELGSEVDLVVFGGDLTWGSLPEETRALVEELPLPSLLIRGNGDRALLRCAQALEAPGGEELSEREAWMARNHSPATAALLSTAVEQAVVDIAGLGPVRFCHGSPRSDEECVTPRTPAARIRELSAGVDERMIVSAHTHVQFDRRVAGLRSVNPGSVGLPYEGRRGAFWAVLGPDVELRRTDYDVEETARRYLATDDPSRVEMVEMLRSPPSAAEAIERAEELVFAG